MLLSQLALLIFGVHSFASPILPRSAQSFVFPGDAPFTVSASALAAALTCPNGSPTTAAPGVLLVHGTGSTGAETWGDGYVPALLATGYTPCYVTLPGRAMGDMQISSEYVAYSLHMLSTLAGGAQVAVISHSQGGPDTQWALRFWPSTQKITRAFIALSPDLAGIQLLGSALSKICVGDLCQASLWQQSAGSNYYNALHADTFQALVPTTTIWSLNDGIVNPPLQNAALPGATSYAVQSLCPGRQTNHILMTIDSAGFAFALDALNHSGKASLARLVPHALSTCLRVAGPGMSLSVVQDLKDVWGELVKGFILGSPRVAQEPAVDAYALAAESE